MFEEQSKVLCAERRSSRVMYAPMDTTYRIMRRLYDIMLAKDTVAYRRYLSIVPIAERDETHPKTPDALSSRGKRSFSAELNEWKKILHRDEYNASNVLKSNKNQSIEMYTSI